MDIERLLSKAKYRYVDQTKRDITNVLTHYRALLPKIEKYTFQNGSEKELVALFGTIPVRYRGNTYNIPVCIYVSDTHPYAPPMCYVRPTADMSIKESKHVDASGMIYLPYLSDWRANSSDLLGVIQVMIIVFGETPPVYQKPKTVPQNVSSASYPQTGYRTSNFQPSYTTAAVSTTQPYIPATTTAAAYPQGTYPAQFPFSNYPGSTTTPYPTVSPYPEVSNQYTPVSPANTGTITEEHIRASLLSAVEDKIKERLREKLGQLQAEVDVLRKTHEDLSTGKTKLDDVMNKIDKEISDLAETKQQLTAKNAQIEEILQKHGDNTKNVEIDDAFGPSEALYKQLLNSFAEENAVVDAVYYLGEALRKGKIDLEVFLKHIRELSRRQFMLRALMQKCREKAGLP